MRGDHLRLLPNLENARRTGGRDWELGGCINGHGAEHWLPKSETRVKGCCRMCRDEQQRKSRAANPEKSAERQRKWRAANREKVVEQSRRARERRRLAQ